MVRLKRIEIMLEIAEVTVISWSQHSTAIVTGYLQSRCLPGLDIYRSDNIKCISGKKVNNLIETPRIEGFT